MRNQLKIGFALFLLLVVLTVILQNTGIVLLHVLGWTIEVSLVLVLALAFLSGAAAGLAVAAILNVRRRRQTGGRTGSMFGA